MPLSLLMPSDTRKRPVGGAFTLSWQFEQATSPVELKRLSWNSLSPSLILASV